MVNIPKIKISTNIDKIFILTGENIFKKKSVKLLIKSSFFRKEIKIYKKKNFLPDILELNKIVKEIKSYKPDLLVAIGGGGVIDYLKIANSVIHLSKIKDIFFLKKNNFKKYKKLIVIPTTAGSGAEVTPGAVLYKNKIKYNFTDRNLIPDKFYLFPELIMGTKRELKSSALFDSFSQSIESLISYKSNKISQKNSLSSIRLILKNYKTFLDNNNYEVTKKMQIAANYSGKSISLTSTGAPHALSYYLSSNFGLYHGNSVIVYLPIVLEYNIRNVNILDKTKKKKFSYRLKILRRAFSVKSDLQIVKKIKSMIKYSKINIRLKKKFLDEKKQKKSIKIERLKNNPIPIDYRQINLFNKKLFL